MGKSKLISIWTDKISQQPENYENRNDPDLVQAFLKKWWVESDFKAPNLPFSLRLKVSGYHYNSTYNNTWTKQVKQLSKQHQATWWHVIITVNFNINLRRFNYRLNWQ
jgi:hypothetical protein